MMDFNTEKFALYMNAAEELTAWEKNFEFY